MTFIQTLRSQAEFYSVHELLQSIIDMTGYVAELYKIVKVNGVQTDRIKINKSTYKGSDRVVTYGTAGDPTLSENLRAAIAAQDEALADANVAAANAAAAAAAPAQ